ncbi:MAG: FMN-binding protein [Desulfocapsaceae bacterium]|jgi:electron transport complex protein RnfG|nr:FMN-binding protein [Desulfocapsaceae bacterium]
MKNILTIIFRLTISCLIAGLVMGTTFVFTNQAKKANEHAREEKVMYSLLGYSKENPIPESMGLHELFRYVVGDGDAQSIGYLLPSGSHDEAQFNFVRIDLDGQFIDNSPVSISEGKVRELKDRDAAVQRALGPGKQIRFVDQTMVVNEDGDRIAYLLGGKFPGFKTHIAIMLALDPNYSVLGLEVMEHEEDPGLGAEIEQDYFKKQFVYKPFEQIKTIEVVKAPLPDEYYQALEGRIDESAAVDIMKQYSDQDIYALTGATISSAAVSSGVRAMARKFAYRLDILDDVLNEQQIAVPF